MIRTPWWFSLALGLIAIGLSFPVDGRQGISLAVIGAALVWLGYAKYRRDLEEGGKR